MRAVRKIVFLFVFFTAWQCARSQKVDSICFHLYTDSLKKGFYNYINIDGKTADGKWLPLSSKELDLIVFDPNLRFENNDLFIDSAYKKETVLVKAVLKSNPAIWKETTIYIRKRGFEEALKTNREILDEYGDPSRKSRRKNFTSSSRLPGISPGQYRSADVSTNQG
ncbi:hypothetical protein GCM10023229_41050 [Flavisolibacter ginsenosidimutans]